MKQLLLTSGLLMICFAVHAQSVNIDLTKVPSSDNGIGLSQRKIADSVNKGTILPANTLSQTSGRNVMPNNNVMSTSNGEMLNNTTNYSNLGKVRMTSSTYYDDQGKMRGSNTSFSFGK